MTKEEILAMKVGLDLDFQVDIKVMSGKGGYLGCPAYSKDFSAAWLVFEKIREMEDGEGNHLLCCLDIYSDHDFAWEVRWSYSELSIYNDGHKKHRSGCFDDLPEAICKAALLAKLERSGAER